MAKRRKSKRSALETGILGVKGLGALLGVAFTVYLFRKKQQAAELEIQERQAALERARQQPSAAVQIAQTIAPVAQKIAKR